MKVKTVETAVIRIDETLVRIDERFNRIDKTLARLQTQNRYFIIPLLLLLVAAMFGLLTKGILWGVTP